MIPARTADIEGLFEPALVALLTTDRTVATELFPDDVALTATHLVVCSRHELLERFDDWDGAFSNITATIDLVSVDGDTATVRWAFNADHTGALLLDEDELFEPTGQTLHISGQAVVVVRNRRIKSASCRENPPTLVAQLRSPR